jgi:hypothetical protein
MTQQAQWTRLPLELRERPQWLLAGPNDKGELKVPLSVNAHGQTVHGSSTDRSTWLSFDAACHYAEHYGLGIGYVLAADDPYCCVDLDVKDADDYPNEPHKWTTEEQRQRHYSISAHLHSYTEYSRGGKGAHVWVRASIGEGCKRDHVEVYSQERFIVCTGNIIAPLPIAERQEMLNNMVISMRAQNGGPLVELEEAAEEEPDELLWARASTAENGEKFRELCAGNWARYHYPSQSEADLSLMSMFTFYSRSNEQCRRMFRRTVLGQRDKAIKDDRYLNLTLRIVRSRQAREALSQQQFIQQNSAVMGAMRAHAAQAAAMPVHETAAAALPQPTGAAQAPQAAPTGLDWPPGYAGAVARVVYESAPRPVKEVAIVAALGFLAGVAGKVWTIPGSGLNMYIVLIARSGVGKEAMHGGLGLIVSSIRERMPAITDFVNFSEFASAPALGKACAKTPSFVNVSGEWGRKLAKLANDKADATMHGLRTMMTNLYQKSGPTSIVGGMQYSDKDKNFDNVAGVAYSMIGESTPETFYQSLTESMMQDGFLSRFTIIEHDGERPPLNHYPRRHLDQPFFEYTTAFVVHAKTAIGNNQNIPVQRDEIAAQMLDAFDKECDARINATEVERERMMWNRAHLKATRLAALLAVGDAYTQPVVNVAHASWAIDVIRRDLALMQKKMDEGDVGTGDNARERKAMAVIKEYVTRGPAPSHKIPPDMPTRGIIPRSYFMNRLQHVAVFSSHHLGSNSAIDSTLRHLCDNGVIREMQKTEFSEDFGFQGRCFQLMRVLS